MTQTPSPSGVLNLYKPGGPTSHDCVGRVRRALGLRRVGHAGTLDPLATGVLVIGVGQGTRILEYLQGLPKTYRARLRLGLSTDSQDITGAPVEERDASAVDRSALEAALAPLRGEIQQLPPMVSALKVGGKKLYELARKGETVERQPRAVTVYSLELLEFQPGAAAEAELRVRCSAGTYVRTLCHDLGEALGVGGTMLTLEREAVGPFLASEAVRLDDLGPATPLLSLSDALAHLPVLEVSEEDARRLAHGQLVPTAEETPDGPLRVLTPDGRLVAVATARSHGPARLLAPEKVLAGGEDGA